MAREIISNGIYHIVVRGIDQMDIFKDDQDHYKILSILEIVKDVHEFKLHAYCLMKNHAHLLIQETTTAINEIMKSICIRFAMYFNKKYDRVGHVFQDRFKSKLIKDETYFIVCARYIHLNPLKAEIVTDLSSYRWSSYPAYTSPRLSNHLVDKNFLYSLFSAYPEKAAHALTDFTLASQSEEEHGFLEVQEKRDEIQVINQILLKHGLNITELSSADRKLKRAILEEILQDTAFSERKLATLLNVSRPLIANVKKVSMQKRTYQKNRPRG